MRVTRAAPRKMLRKGAEVIERTGDLQFSGFWVFGFWGFGVLGFLGSLVGVRWLVYRIEGWEDWVMGGCVGGGCVSLGRLCEDTEYLVGANLESSGACMGNFKALLNWRATLLILART